MASVEDHFATDAATANFNVLSIARSRKRRAAYSVRHVPWANQNIVQLGGRLEAERQYTLFVPSQAELDNLDLCLGLQGTLHYEEGDVTAALVEYDASDYFAGGPQLVKASFITDSD